MPTGRQIHVDKPLSNMLVAAFETQGDFVAQSIFPVVPVDKQSDKYYVLRKESWLKIAETRRAPRTRANRIEFDVSSNSYFADNYAIGAEIPLEDLANADTAIRLRETNTALIARQLLADYEQRVAAAAIAGAGTTLVTSTGGVATGLAWDAVNSADIAGQIQNGHVTIFQNTGLRANTLVLDYQSYMYAKRNVPGFTRFQYRAQGTALLSDDQLKELFMVDNLLIARSQKNNANPAQTASITSIWGPTALLCRVENANAMMSATFGSSFRWTSPELGAPMAVQRAVEDGAGSRKIEILEGGYYQDEKVVASELAYYINTKSGQVW